MSLVGFLPGPATHPVSCLHGVVPEGHPGTERKESVARAVPVYALAIGASLCWTARGRRGGTTESRNEAVPVTSASVEVIQPADRRRGVAALTLAFAADPIMRWAWPDAYQYATYWPRIAEAYGGRAFDYGAAHAVEDFAAIALWLPPGIESDEAALGEVIAESCSDQILSDLNAVFEQMAQLHPAGDLWFLPLIGVDPVAQGRGLGSALLRHGLAACDRDGLPAYLEATSPRNRALYERHGFRVIDVIQDGSSPPMWAMLREPRSGDPGPAV
jgi:GNAT superfamily N-acetyltransferase